MKNIKPFLFLICLLLLAGCQTAEHRGGGTAVVEFVNPEKYTDIQLRDIPADRAREQLLPDLERYIEKQANTYISAGQRLKLRITDIDDAGWIRPVGVFPKRVVRQSQPGRVDFEYELSDTSGKTIAAGKETLSDLPWDRMDRTFDTEQLPLIKQLLREWIRKTGRAAKG